MTSVLSCTTCVIVLWREARSRHIWLFHRGPSESDGHIYGRVVDWALGKGRLGEQRLVPALESLLVNLGNMSKQNEAKESTWFFLHLQQWNCSRTLKTVMFDCGGSFEFSGGEVQQDSSVRKSSYCAHKKTVT